MIFNVNIQVLNNKILIMIKIIIETTKFIYNQIINNMDLVIRMILQVGSLNLLMVYSKKIKKIYRKLVKSKIDQ